jgi:hypothetical protein
MWRPRVFAHGVSKHATFLTKIRTHIRQHELCARISGEFLYITTLLQVAPSPLSARLEPFELHQHHRSGKFNIHSSQPCRLPFSPRCLLLSSFLITCDYVQITVSFCQVLSFHPPSVVSDNSRMSASKGIADRGSIPLGTLRAVASFPAEDIVMPATTLMEKRSPVQSELRMSTGLQSIRSIRVDPK